MFVNLNQYPLRRTIQNSRKDVIIWNYVEELPDVCSSIAFNAKCGEDNTVNVVQEQILLTPQHWWHKERSTGHRVAVDCISMLKLTWDCSHRTSSKGFASVDFHWQTGGVSWERGRGSRTGDVVLFIKHGLKEFERHLLRRARSSTTTEDYGGHEHMQSWQTTIGTKIAPIR